MARHRPGRKKRRTREHVIADLSVNFVERVILRCGFSAERITHDYGVDLVLFTYNANGEIENGFIELQLKATDHLRVLADGRTVSYPVNSADLRLWLWEPFPIVLVVYDARRDRAFWLHVQQYGDESGINPDDEKRDSVTVRVPMANKLGVQAIQELRRRKQAILAQLKGGSGHGK